MILINNKDQRSDVYISFYILINKTLKILLIKHLNINLPLYCNSHFYSLFYFIKIIMNRNIAFSRILFKHILT